MGKEYYYLAASLPFLQFDMEPPMSSHEYLDECARHLSEHDDVFVRALISEKILDYALLQRLLQDNRGEIKASNPTFVKGAQFNRSFRNELAHFRAERAKKDPNSYVRGERHPEPYIVDVIQQIDKTKNLLEGERLLEKMRWDFFEEMEAGHTFDLEFLIIYGFKLKLLERLQEFKSTKGNEKFESIKNMDIEYNF